MIQQNGCHIPIQ